MPTKIKINIDPTDKIKLKRNLGNNGPAQKLFTSEVARLSDPYVPMETGVMKNTRIIGNDKVTYPQVYSRKQWNENKGKGLRGKMWCLRMWADRGKEVVNTIAKFVGGKAK